MGKHLFQNYEYFEVYSCKCTTYGTTDGVAPGQVIEQWRPSSSYGIQFNTIVDAVKRFAVAPFPQSPKDWRFEDGTVYVSMLSSNICGSYAGNDFAKKPTKTEMKKFEQGQRELYIVEFAIDVQKVTCVDIDAEMANAEGIGSGSTPVVSAKKVSKRNKKITAAAKLPERIGYAIDYRNMHTAIHGLIWSPDENLIHKISALCEELENTDSEELYEMYVGELEGYLAANEAFIEEEINYRDILKDDKYYFDDDQYVEIVNVLPYDLYM